MLLFAIALWMHVLVGSLAARGGVVQDSSATDSTAASGTTADSASDSSDEGDSIVVDSALVRQVKFQVTASPETVTVGDHITVTVRAHLPADLAAALQFPAAPDSSQNVVAGVTPVQRHDVSQGGYVDATATYVVSAWAPGRVGIPLGYLTIGKGNVPIPATAIVVRSVLPKDSVAQSKAQPKDPRGLLAEPLLLRILHHPSEHRGPFAAILLALAAAVAGGLWWWHSRRQGAGAPTGDWVAREFQRIEAMRLVENGQPERHAILMATVLRQYLIRTFAAVRASATTREMTAALRGESFIPAERVLALFQRVDLLKFAHAGIQGGDAQSIGVECRGVVQEILDRHQAAVIALEAARRGEAGKKSVGNRRQAA